MSWALRLPRACRNSDKIAPMKRLDRRLGYQGLKCLIYVSKARKVCLLHLDGLNATLSTNQNTPYSTRRVLDVKQTVVGLSAGGAGPSVRPRLKVLQSNHPMWKLKESVRSHDHSRRAVDEYSAGKIECREHMCGRERPKLRIWQSTCSTR